MALPFLKKEEGKEPEPKKAEKKRTTDSAAVKPSQEAEGTVQPVASGSVSLPEISLLLEAPHVTEKAVRLADTNNQYVFRVVSRATKHQVKQAIESIYNVEVEGVRMVHIPPKKVRFRRREGTKKSYKKALVSVKKGQKIDVLPT